MEPPSIRPISPSRDAVLAGCAALIALLIRLPAALQSSFPLYDGGLFYQMILDLQRNGFRLPMFTTYNSEAIPFAYPPFALYLAGLFASAFRVDVLAVLRIAPPVISSLCIPAFYFLARSVLRTRQETVLAATLAFALIPRAFEWQIMGGGITRSWGLLFALLTIRSAYILFSEPSPRKAISAVLWGSLTVLSHPEAATQTVLAVLIVFLVANRSVRCAWYALGVSGAVALICAPWWGLVLARHGLAPFLAAAAAARDATSVDLPARLFLAFQFNFTEEPYLPIIAFLGLVGLFAQLGKREFLLPIWVIIPLFFEPRSAPQFMAIPLAMLAGLGLLDVVVPALGKIQPPRPGRASLGVAGFLAYTVVYAVLSDYVVVTHIAKDLTLQAPNQAALAWVRNQAPPGSRFVLVTGAGPFSDPLSDWFPAMTQRKSLNTLFGEEWVRAVSLRQKIVQYTSLQNCRNQDEDCLAKWQDVTGADFTNVLIQKDAPSPPLLASLRRSPNYRLVFENEAICIFEKDLP